MWCKPILVHFSWACFAFPPCSFSLSSHLGCSLYSISRLVCFFAAFTSGHTHSWTGWFTLHPGRHTPLKPSSSSPLITHMQTHTYVVGVWGPERHQQWPFVNPRRSSSNPQSCCPCHKEGVVTVYPGGLFEHTHTLRHRPCTPSTCQPDTPSVIMSDLWEKETKCAHTHESVESE